MKRNPYLTEINRAIRAAGRSERVIRSPRGYYYLTNGDSHTFPATAVYMYRVDHARGADCLRASIVNLYAGAGIALQLAKGSA